MSVWALVGLALGGEVAEDASDRIAVAPGKSVVLALSQPAVRTVITAEQTARVFALDEQTLLIQGVAIGTTDLVVTYTGSDRVDQWDLAVQRDVKPLRGRIQHIVDAPPAPRTSVH